MTFAEISVKVYYKTKKSMADEHKHYDIVYLTCQEDYARIVLTLIIKRGKKMKTGKREGNDAFIDGNNLYLGAKNQDININYGKFRKYLRTKFMVKNAYIFIGFDSRNTGLYNALQKNGYILVFKPTIPYLDEDGERTMKGNVDAELVLHASAIEYNNYEKAIIVSGDGDFACLLKYLEENNKLEKVITPTQRYSKLLRPYNKYILPLNLIKRQISK